MPTPSHKHGEAESGSEKRPRATDRVMDGEDLRMPPRLRH